ncbi:MAG: vWA domain-containing protein [Planctomycetota bacterium]|nr:vWA domain-containing protein [Planctomycetota bacterium]
MHSVLVLDASGSMASFDWPPSRIEAAKQAARAFWRRRAEALPDARVALVAYSTSAQLLCQPTSVRDEPALDTAIDGLRPGGTTNMQAGLELAWQLLDGTRSQGPGEIVLLTDGLNNQQDPRPVAEAIKQFAIVNTVGIGARNEVDESLLRTLASEYPDGRKRYRWIGDKEGLIGHFRSLGAGIRKA